MKLNELLYLLEKNHILARGGELDDGIKITPEDFIKYGGGNREIKSCKFCSGSREMTAEEIEDYINNAGKGDQCFLKLELEPAPEAPPDPRAGFYTITKEQWNKIPEDYKLHRKGEPRATFLCFLTPDGTGGDVLCFEGQHFKIIDTEEGKQ